MTTLPSYFFDPRFPSDPLTRAIHRHVELRNWFAEMIELGLRVTDTLDAENGPR